MKTIIASVGIALLIRIFLFTPVVVDGESMMPTLKNDERMVVNKINYNLSSPKRFDVIVFHASETKDYVKRIIGLPGDKVEYKNDKLYINGKVYNEPYLDYYKSKLTDGDLLTYDFKLEEIPPNYSKTVPKGHYFVLGDNRRNSLDSRIIGSIPKGKILGKVSLVYWPVKDITYSF